MKDLLKKCSHNYFLKEKMKKNNLRTIRRICQFLPPIIAQQVRERLMTNQEAEELAMEFKRESFTGGILCNNTRDFHAFRFYVHGYYDWRNIILAKRILKINNGDFVEVGANIGTETVSLVSINKYNCIHAFEPLSTNFKQLEQIKAENNFRNLILYNFLVADKSGRANFSIPQFNNSGSGHIILSQNSTEELPNFKVVTLDEELQNLQSCSAIFIDVEGFEYQVLCGAKEIIRRFKPFIILEVNKKFLKDRAGITVSFLHQQLREMGYRSFYIEKMGIKEVDPHNFEIKANKNWLCLPQEHSIYEKVLSRSICLNALNPFMAKRIF